MEIALHGKHPSAAAGRRQHRLDRVAGNSHGSPQTLPQGAADFVILSWPEVKGIAILGIQAYPGASVSGSLRILDVHVMFYIEIQTKVA
jgi:hypothetical protein